MRKWLQVLLGCPQGRRDLNGLLLSVCCYAALLFTISHSNSLVLHVFSLITLFHILLLLMDAGLLILSRREHKEDFSYGYERADVLAVFSVTMLVQLGCLFVVKEGMEEILESYKVNVDAFMLLVPTVAYAIQLFIIYFVPNWAIGQVINASSSNWIQEQVADISHSLCKVVPGLSTLLLPRFHPIALLSTFAWLICVINYSISVDGTYKNCDSILCLLLACMVIGTMYPLALYSGRILLQACPSHLLSQLDKCLREVATTDGILEVADEHFWQLSFGKVAGTVVVRVRRDADEQVILSRVVEKLHPYVAELTVQVVKDTCWKPQINQK